MEKLTTTDKTTSSTNPRLGKKKNYFEQKYTGVETNLSTFLSFQIADFPFVVPIRLSGEIVKEFYIAIIPTAPKYILGLTNIRGTLLPVLDLNLLLGKTSQSDPKYLMVLEYNHLRICLALPQLPETSMLPKSIADFELLSENSMNQIDLLSFPFESRIYTVLNIPLLFSQNFLLQ